ncbi:hypothetical protein NIES30_07720 [Phormidium tenue NIES-30]|uniref:Uncharacterized protein n=1 Tax=Phormidium tenue NIES-30 TaxID=549789 RepID=A0A1U7J7G7_9CYAN|nr:hypothetical protein NIES30_07720 [Phormidium tenue NIES-30]
MPGSRRLHIEQQRAIRGHNSQNNLGSMAKVNTVARSPVGMMKGISQPVLCPRGDTFRYSQMLDIAA